MVPNLNTAKIVLTRAAVTALLLSFPSAAAACGLCTYALMWNVMPPVVTWCIVASMWFVALSWIKWATHAPLKWVPGPVASVILALVAWAAGILVIGPPSSLVFLPCCIVGTIAVLKVPADKPALIRSRRLVMVVGAMAVAWLAVGSAVAIHRAARMSPADKIVMWSGTALERNLMAQLKKVEPASADEYRKVIAAEPSFVAAHAAERLGGIGDPSSDIPLLIAAMERSDASKEQYVKSIMADAVRKAVATLGKFDIATTATAAQVRAAWIAKQSEQ